MPAFGVVVFERRHAGGMADQLTDTFSRFYLVVSGHARWQSGSRRYLLGPDTLCHIPAGQASSQETLPNEPVTVYAIRYRPDLLSAGVSGQFSALGMLPLDLGSTNSNQGGVVRSTFQEMLFEQDASQEGWELILQSRLIDLAVRALRMLRRQRRDDLPVFEPGSDSTDRVARYALRLKSRFYRQEKLSEAARSSD